VYETTKENGVYSSIEDYDYIAETSEGYSELKLVATENQETPADVASMQPEEQTTSADVPELPPPRPPEYLELISWRFCYHIAGSEPESVVKMHTTQLITVVQSGHVPKSSLHSRKIVGLWVSGERVEWTFGEVAVVYHRSYWLETLVNNLAITSWV